MVFRHSLGGFLELTELRKKTACEITESLKELLQLTLEEKESIPILPEISAKFSNLHNSHIIGFKKGTKKLSSYLKVGVVLSGGPASGGHNVIAALFDAIKELNHESELIGFLNGPSGIIENQYRLLKKEEIDFFRNQGGFDLIGSGRTKIESAEQFEKSLKCARFHQLDGLLIVGGDDSNTNAAFLADYFVKNNQPTAVVGVPKTIDGDLKNRFVETSFGFDSASKTYSEMIGNLLNDAASQGKYYFFVKVMGRTASHLVLECALKTHPTLTFISEEIAEQKKDLNAIVQELVEVILERAKQGKNHGVFLIPEGIIEFIPDFQTLIKELNSNKTLSTASKAIFDSLPVEIQKQLNLDRDPHGNVQVSKIETERLLIELVTNALKLRADYKEKFSPQPVFYGYEGRSCLPSIFDSNYCYNLGRTAALLIKFKLNGYMATLRNLTADPSEWEPYGVPLLGMMDIEERKGELKPVIKKSLVDLEGHPYQAFLEGQKEWRNAEKGECPGPIQFYGPKEIVNEITITLALEKSFHL